MSALDKLNLPFNDTRNPRRPTPDPLRRETAMGGVMGPPPVQVSFDAMFTPKVLKVTHDVFPG